MEYSEVPGIGMTYQERLSEELGFKVSSKE